jgi:hypothetical protein
MLVDERTGTTTGGVCGQCGRLNSPVRRQCKRCGAALGDEPLALIEQPAPSDGMTPADGAVKRMLGRAMASGVVKQLLVLAVAGGFAAKHLAQYASSQGGFVSEQDIGGAVGVFVGNVVIGEVVLLLINRSRKD